MERKLSRVWGGDMMGKEVEKERGGKLMEGGEELEGMMKERGFVRVGGVWREEVVGREKWGGVIEG